MPKEGELYKELTAFGVTFPIYYGYYEDFERESSPPIPIYPDFAAAPVYTAEGHPFVTEMQDMCDKGVLRHASLGDRCCGNCRAYLCGQELLGICLSSQIQFTGDDK